MADATRDEPRRNGHVSSQLYSRGKLCQDLFEAVGRGDVAGLTALLRRGADPNARNSLEMTPLMIAASTGRIPVVEALLRGGAKRDAWCIFGTPLTFAAMTGQAEVARFLLDRGADVGAKRPDGITVLMMAARSGAPEIVRDLLARKAEVNAKDSFQRSAFSFQRSAEQRRALPCSAES